MIYIFTFLGEFGYELLNWQGVVRKFSATIQPDDKIVCCSRANLHPLYECADAFVDITDVPLYRRSRASGYRALPDMNRRWDLASRKLDRELKRELTIFIREQLRAQKSLDRAGQEMRFIFSSDRIELHGCKFGYSGRRQSLPSAILGSVVYNNLESWLGENRMQVLRRVRARLTDRFGLSGQGVGGDIYGRLELGNNVYRKIEPDLSVLPTVAAKLGWSPDEPFLLFQGRKRDTSQPSSEALPVHLVPQILQRFSRHIKSVLLSFDTQRRLDSYSRFEEVADYTLYHCSSFPEQACLIHFARHCIFLSEGDFGSHIYVPPFLGKDVTVIAPESVYALDTSPIDFWNTHIFTFGGQIVPWRAEEVSHDEASIERFVQETMGEYVGG